MCIRDRRGPGGRDPDEGADAGGADAPQDVIVDLGPEVSHRGLERARGQPFVVAQRAAHDVRAEVRKELRVGRAGQAGGDPLADLVPVSYTHLTLPTILRV